MWRNEGNLTLDLRETGLIHALKTEGLTLAPGTSIDFLLAENPSTGYSWSVDKQASNNLWAVKSETHTKPSDEDSEVMVGLRGIKKITVEMGEKEGRSIFRALH